MIVRLLMFATAREAAARSSDNYELADDATLATLLAAAVERYGPHFGEVLATSRVWINGEEPAPARSGRLQAGDEVAVLPPVSGGATS